MKPRYPIAAACVLAFFAMSAAAQELEWRADYNAALEEAKRSGKPLFLEFRCVP